jgi:hypothetical protein
MTPAAFAAALERLGWSKRHLVDLLRCDTNLPTRWARGDAEIPPPIATWLTGLTGAHHAHPPPQDWRRRA